MRARFFALLLVFCLFAGGAFAAEHTVSGLFSISYDSDVFELDCISYCDDSTPEQRWLFLLYGNEILIDADMQPAVDYTVQSLDGADEKTLRAYLDEMAFVGCEHADTVYAGDVPFGVFRLENEDGPYLLAETLANGWCIDFYAYYDQAAAVDEKLMQVLCGVVESYRPAR